MNKVLLSICIPVYNVEPYIEKCAESILSQMMPGIECIFVNDCTPDNSIKILETVIDRYQDSKTQVRIINHEKNLGLGGARLTGFNNAKGKYIWCIDSDDWISKNSINSLFSLLKGDYDFIAFNYLYHTKCGIAKGANKDITISNILGHKVAPSIWKFIVKKDIYRNYNILPKVGINHAEDFFLTSKIVLVAKKKIFLKDYYYNYNLMNDSSYVHNVSVSSLESKLNVILDVIDFYKINNGYNNYRIDLAVLLAKSLLDLDKKDPNNVLLFHSKNVLKKIDPITYFIFKCLHKRNNAFCYKIEYFNKIIRTFHL